MNEWGMMLFIFIAGTGSMYYLRKSSRISHL
jgi:N-acetylglucosamine kinase-like BadF-type ATPase